MRECGGESKSRSGREGKGVRVIVSGTSRSLIVILAIYRSYKNPWNEFSSSRYLKSPRDTPFRCKTLTR